MSERIKYLHILFPEVVFNANLLKMLESPENNFYVNDHLFLIASRDAYQELCCYNVKIRLISNDCDYGSIVNSYAKWCDWIFIHGIIGRYHGIRRIKKEYRHKIIWRTWGHDGYQEYTHLYLLKKIKRLLRDKLYYRTLNSFYKVGIANSVDSVGLNKAKITLPQIRMPYPQREDSMIDYQKLLAEREFDGMLRVLIGHSGSVNDRHKYVIDLVKKYKGHNVLFFIPLSYGSKKYIVKIEKHAFKTLSSQAVIIKEFMNYEDYVKFLSRIDIGIFAGTSSYALGNIALMLKLQKTIYLDNKGLLSEAFSLENIPYKNINELSNMDFCDFSKTLDYFCDPRWTLSLHSYAEDVLAWKECLNALDQEKS